MINTLAAQLKKSEHAYQHELLKKLMPQVKNCLPSKTRPAAQLVFCIDVRSEPFRRHLEPLGAYETLGFAGFFGIPARIHDVNSNTYKESCPVLLKPRYDIEEKPLASALPCVKKAKQGKARFHLLKKTYYGLKYNFSTPFALVETLGAWCGLTMLTKTLAPRLTDKACTSISNRFMPSLPTKPIIQMSSANSVYGIAPAEQAFYGEAVLKMMGLTQNFAKLIVFCGHRSSTQNNPYASALDCGACGGNHGGSNAKILAAILNNPPVRETLAKRGIIIPDDTFFYAAEHDTTTDEVTLFEADLGLHAHQTLLDELRDDLNLARHLNAQARCQTLGVTKTSHSIQTTLTRSSDWAEVRPEWGLARNAAFIVGPRQLTKPINLDGRCFLHSYDWTQDKEGSALETILTAPMVVAEWINTQYLFSTLDNVLYGSGSKITQNVTGLLGMMQGNGSDLMHGLPLQSVKSTDEEAYHEPQRLLTVVYAPRTRVSAIIARQDSLKTLFFNGWVNLVVIEPAEEVAYQLDREGHWHML
ncbi:putative transmembrane protein [Legionella busanensis]|uniref:Putative transmembrane protein n=1 Tax=Legionella busanensis TaxID=190655 RepID=A0A378KAJ3_9GAMM|nr:putative transmembrane protein [Legionella busanensis]